MNELHCLASEEMSINSTSQQMVLYSTAATYMTCLLILYKNINMYTFLEDARRNIFLKHLKVTFTNALMEFMTYMHVLVNSQHKFNIVLVPILT